jgi:hypothetical protein
MFIGSKPDISNYKNEGGELHRPPPRFISLGAGTHLLPAL